MDIRVCRVNRKPSLSFELQVDSFHGSSLREVKHDIARQKCRFDIDADALQRKLVGMELDVETDLAVPGLFVDGDAHVGWVVGGSRRRGSAGVIM